MKPSFFIFACLLVTVAFNTQAVALLASFNDSEQTPVKEPSRLSEKISNLQSADAAEDKLDTLTAPTQEQKKPLIDESKINNAKVLGSELTKLAQQPKNKVDKAIAVAQAEQAITQAKDALTARQQAKAKQSRESLAVVEQLINAYNARNIEEFIRMYDEDVEFYIFPNELLFKGKEKLIARYGIMFKKLKCLHASPIKRIVHGDIVIDHELSETCSTDANVIDKRSELISSYQIKDGKIVRVLFFR